MNSNDISLINDLLGKKGVIAVFAILIFIISYRNNIKVFQWIDNQTLGTRDYILKSCELLMWEVDPQKLTYFLLGITFGPAVLSLGIFIFLGNSILGVVLAILFFVIGWKLPRPFMDHMIEKRKTLYHTQMVDGLNLLANGLRAGLSVPQSLATVVDELTGPISQEFNLVLQQTRIGVPLEQAFESLNHRVPIEDNEMFVTSINILRETGGNLAEVFDTIVYVIRERVRLQQKISIFTAQVRMQAAVILSMPTGLLLYFGVTNEDAVKVFVSPIGIVLLIVVYGLNFVAGFVMWKTMQIRV